MGSREEEEQLKKVYVVDFVGEASDLNQHNTQSLSLQYI